MDFRFTYRNSRNFIYLIIFLFLSQGTTAQVDGTGSGGPVNGGTWEIFPMTNQLYPRVPGSLIAYVRVKGYFAAGITDGKLLVIKDSDNDGSYDSEPSSSTTTYKIITSASDPRNFDFEVPITAGLFSYRLRLLNGYNWVTTTDNIVAGDAYYISGQSNAEAKPVDPDGTGPIISPDINIANDEADQQEAIPGGSGGARKFIRVFGGGTSKTPKWNKGDANKDYNSEYNLGQFGMRLGARIVREQKIPVAIMNGAEYGNPIRYFQKDYTLELDGDGLNNYGRELKRLTLAGLKDHIRAVIWFQGESNTYDDVDPYHSVPHGQKLSTVDYVNEFTKLYNSWVSDLGLAQQYYIIQIRPGCFVSQGETEQSVLAIQEAQRVLDESIPNVSIVSTNNLPKSNVDDCHYNYLNGYKKIGDRLFTLINRDFYGKNPISDQLTPTPRKVEFSGLVPNTQIANQVSLYFNQPFDNYKIVGDVKLRFKLEGGSYTITAATIKTASATSENYLTLDFQQNTGTTTNPTGLSFYSNASGTSSSPAVANGFGDSLGLISFYNYPLSLGILPVDPLSLRINSNGGSNTIIWEADNNPMFEQFIIERGVTANEFSAIGSIQGNLKSGKVTYQQVDFKPNAARNYYRIKAIKIDGKELYSQVVAVNNRTSSVAGISVYPNPVSDRANVSLTLKKAGPATLQIFDPSGRLVSTRQLNLQKGNNMFSAGELLDQSAGIYTIRVVTTEEVFNTRVVRVK